MWRPACQILSKALDISSATAGVAPDLLIALPILSDTTVKRSAVDQEDLKPYWKSEKSYISLVIDKPIIFKFFNDFTNHRKNTNRAVVFSCRPCPKILKNWDNRRNLPKTGKQESFRQLLKRPTSM